ncbi:hypothetical protein [Shewanella glacialipiscicola]|uniref:Membrane protein n=1 Tax=Shewanella glacialipiscicola TaxID=614069 RepID=A0ABQ6J6U3_9GAMM|nr:hypothetical protein [Shewanella glacialipiscicola]MCL1085403.1 hypothetical protein [Shewanella glacialipiscicola]GIU03821.1 membrane protein [Shewanella glacialipiscicola]GMA83847.1 membrane protein [Shewanella glacialipiscicola]
MVFSWGNLATKQLIVGMVCHIIALAILAYGVYTFYWLELILPELTRCVGAAVLFVAMGLAPKLFFMPVSQIVSQAEDTTEKSTLQTYVFNLGIFLMICSLLMEWLYD